MENLICMYIGHICIALLIHACICGILVIFLEAGVTAIGGYIVIMCTSMAGWGLL